jgi:asparagine synthase (glutamine-hydrolysing)
MCGIWCLFGSTVDTHQQLPSCFNIAHRGPDCFRFENVNHFSRCIFGFHRLAIVDDIYGMQPMRLHALPHIWMVSFGFILLQNNEFACLFLFFYRLIMVKFTISDR